MKLRKYKKRKRIAVPKIIFEYQQKVREFLKFVIDSLTKRKPNE